MKELITRIEELAVQVAGAQLVRHSETLAAMDKATALGADYVRCRACANTGAPLMRNKSWIALDDTCQPLNGPDDMLCPCGKMREPYDCQGDEWMTKEGGR